MFLSLVICNGNCKCGKNFNRFTVIDEVLL
jgi:hypothetical protein